LHYSDEVDPLDAHVCGMACSSSPSASRPSSAVMNIVSNAGLSRVDVGTGQVLKQLFDGQRLSSVCCDGDLVVVGHLDRRSLYVYDTRVAPFGGAYREIAVVGALFPSVQLDHNFLLIPRYAVRGRFPADLIDLRKPSSVLHGFSSGIGLPCVGHGRVVCCDKQVVRVYDVNGPYTRSLNEPYARSPDKLPRFLTFFNTTFTSRILVTAERLVLGSTVWEFV
jgi:hypothetical protein